MSYIKIYLVQNNVCTYFILIWTCTSIYLNVLNSIFYNQQTMAKWKIPPIGSIEDDSFNNCSQASWPTMLCLDIRTVIPFLLNCSIILVW